MFKKEKNNTEEKDYNESESKLSQMWGDKQGNALLKLIMWFIFLLFIVILCGPLSSSKDNQNKKVINETSKEEEKVKDFDTILSLLKSGNYKYQYKIDLANYSVTYKGEKIKELEYGYKQTKKDTVEYYKDDTGIYSINLDELNYYDKLYDRINEEYIDVDTIIDKIKDASVTSETLDSGYKNTYTLNMDNKTITVIVETDFDNVKSITITDNKDVYSLTFTDINKLVNLSYTPKIEESESNIENDN